MSVTTIEGVVSNSEKNMGLDDNVKSNEEDNNNNANNASRVEGSDNEEGGTLSRYMSESSVAATEEDEDDEDGMIELGPQCTLKEQLEKDKADESLRRWKERLLGSVDINAVGETLEPEVKIVSLAIKSAGRPDIVLPILEGGNPKGLWFTHFFSFDYFQFVDDDNKSYLEINYTFDIRKDWQ